MQYILTPYCPGNEPFAWWENAFSEQELDWLQNKARAAKERAKTGTDNNNASEHIRRSNIDWLNCNLETKWVFDKLAHIGSSLNAQFFRFNLTGFGEPLQLTNYDQSEHGMYTWHQDYTEKVSISRKLSLVLQLSEPNSYEGGDLQVVTGQSPTSIKKQRGLVVAFPSYILHRVTPVVRGSRQSLVSWISGPPFK